jgi:hypothetical protein
MKIELKVVEHEILYLLTTWSTVVQKLTVSQLVKKFPPFMELDVSLPYSSCIQFVHDTAKAKSVPPHARKALGGRGV